MPLKRSAIAVVVAAAVMGTADASSASAKGNPCAHPRSGCVHGYLSSPTSGQGRADFWFVPAGDYVEVRDLQNDGLASVVTVWWGGRLHRTCWDTNGAHLHNRNKGLHVCNFNLPEHTRITMHLDAANKRTCTKLHPSRGCHIYARSPAYHANTT